MQIHLCMSRGYQRLVGEPLFPIVTVAGNAVISLILGSVFFQLPPSADSVNSRCVLLFFAILFNGLSSALEVSIQFDPCYNARFIFKVYGTDIKIRSWLSTLSGLLSINTHATLSTTPSLKPSHPVCAICLSKSYLQSVSMYLYTSWQTCDRMLVASSSSFSLDSRAP